MKNPLKVEGKGRQLPLPPSSYSAYDHIRQDFSGLALGRDGQGVSRPSNGERFMFSFLPAALLSCSRFDLGLVTTRWLSKTRQCPPNPIPCAVITSGVNTFTEHCKRVTTPNS